MLSLSPGDDESIGDTGDPCDPAVEEAFLPPVYDPVFIQIDTDAVVGEIRVVVAGIGKNGHKSSSGQKDGAFQLGPAVVADPSHFPEGVVGEKAEGVIAGKVRLPDDP